ncbi:unnamed protein product [Toxocara canis]|uniref:Transposase n=1 Tax=Toxocara canis TaxID=6265 RepID=A0A183V123_TOXCA|nr:unnamed protein product [Toxocara canis]
MVHSNDHNAYQKISQNYRATTMELFEALGEKYLLQHDIIPDYWSPKGHLTKPSIDTLISDDLRNDYETGCV